MFYELVEAINEGLIDEPSPFIKCNIVIFPLKDCMDISYRGDRLITHIMQKSGDCLRIFHHSASPENRKYSALFSGAKFGFVVTKIN